MEKQAEVAHKRVLDYMIVYFVQHVVFSSKIPYYDNLPSEDKLQAYPRDKPMLFRLNRPVTAAAALQQYNTSTKLRKLAEMTPSELVSLVTEAGWPTAVGPWPLCEVSRVSIMRCQAMQASLFDNETAEKMETMMKSSMGHSFRQVVHATRWNLVGSSFAIERYQLLALVLPYSALESKEYGLDEAKCVLSSAGGSFNMYDNVLACEVVSPAHVCGRRVHDVRLMGTVCRIISNEGGRPLSPTAAVANLLHPREFSSMVSLFQSATPLLGEDEQKLKCEWQKCLAERSSTSFALSEDCSGHRNSSAMRHSSSSREGLGVGEYGGSGIGDESSDLVVDWDMQSLLSRRGGAAAQNNSSGFLSAPETPDNTICAAATAGSIRVALFGDSGVDGGAATPGSARRGTHPGARVSSTRRFDTVNGQAHGAQSRCDLFEDRSPHVQWQAEAMSHLFENAGCLLSIEAGWERWRMACNEGIFRGSVVNSLDEIVEYCKGSRGAFYTSVAYLDRFVAVTTDPIATCRRFLLDICPDTSYGSAAMHNATCGPQEVITFFKQVITVCAMLGCKDIDTYPPLVNEILKCTPVSIRLQPREFVLLELHVLGALQYSMQIVTVDVVLDTLLYIGGGDRYQDWTRNTLYRRYLESAFREGDYAYEQVQLRLVNQKGTKGGWPVLDASELDKPSATDCRSGNAAAALGDGLVNSKAFKEWKRFSYRALFICDLVVRGRPRDAISRTRESQGGLYHGNGGGSTLSALEISPIFMGIAIIVVTAEALNTVVPLPLLRLLPAWFQSRLQEKGLASQTPPKMSSGSDLERQTRPTKCFPVEADDDSLALLKWFSALASSFTALRSGGGSGGVTWPARDRWGELDTAIEEVLTCYNESSCGQCDSILQRRYRGVL